MASHAPDLVTLYWDPYLNGQADPFDLAPSNPRLAWWRSPNFLECGSEAAHA